MSIDGFTQYFLDGFTQHLRDRDRAPATVTAYGQELARFAAWFEQTNGQALMPTALTSRDVRDYREWLQAVAHAAPRTVNGKLAAIRAYGAWLVESGQLASNPAEHVKLIGEAAIAPHSLDRRQLSALERELERAVNAATTDVARFIRARDRAIVRLLVHSGLRVAELCALEMDDLQLSERGGSVTVRRGKGNKQRTVPLNVEARRALVAWLAIHYDIFSKADPRERLFCDFSRAPLRPRGVQRAIAEYGRRAAVEVTPHTLRHTFAKSLADAGVRAEEIAALLGHSKLETTRRYTQPTGRDLEKAVDKLAD